MGKDGLPGGEDRQASHMGHLLSFGGGNSTGPHLIAH